MVTSNFKKLNKTKNSKDKYDIAEFSKLQSVKKKNMTSPWLHLSFKLDG